MSYAKWRPFRTGLRVLVHKGPVIDGTVRVYEYGMCPG